MCAPEKATEPGDGSGLGHTASVCDSDREAGALGSAGRGGWGLCHRTGPTRAEPSSHRCRPSRGSQKVLSRAVRCNFPSWGIEGQYTCLVAAAEMVMLVLLCLLVSLLPLKRATQLSQGSAAAVGRGRAGRGAHCLSGVLSPVVSVHPQGGPRRRPATVLDSADSASLWVLEERLSVMSSRH